MRLRTGQLWFFVLLLQVTTLHAQDAPPDFLSPTGWRSDFGLGIIVNPEYQGGGRYRVLAVSYFDVGYSDRLGVKTFFNCHRGSAPTSCVSGSLRVIALPYLLPWRRVFRIGT